MQTKKSQKGSIVMVAVITIIIVITTVVIGWIIVKNKILAPKLEQTQKLAENSVVEWKNFSLNGGAFSFKYPSRICGEVNISSCHEIKVIYMDDMVAIGETLNGDEGEYIEPIFKIYYKTNLNQKEAEKYLQNNGFTEFDSWDFSKKGVLGEVSVITGTKYHAAYSKTLSTLVAFTNNLDMACLIDCGAVENELYRGIKLDGIEVYNEDNSE